MTYYGHPGQEAMPLQSIEDPVVHGWGRPVALL